MPKKATAALIAYGSAGHGEWKKACYPHFTSGNQGTEKLSDLPKVTQEVCSQSHEAQSSALTTHQLLSFMW